MVCPYWVGHSCVTSVHFGPTVCLALWLLASAQIDCISLTAVLVLDMSIFDTNYQNNLAYSTIQIHFWQAILHHQHKEECLHTNHLI